MGTFYANKDDGFKVDTLTDDEIQFIKDHPGQSLFKDHETRPFVMYISLYMPDGKVDKIVSSTDVMSIILNCF